MQKKHNDNQFNFFIPASFEKGKKNGQDVVRVKGIASTSTVADSDGETLFPDGFDYSPLLQKGFLNWDHQQKSRPSAIIGEPDVAKVINGGKDFYIEGFLYNHSKEAQECADLAEVLEKNSPTRRLGYSIEGQVLERGCGPEFLDKEKKVLNPEYRSDLWKQVKRARITGLAITPCPKNPNTLLSLIKGEYSEAFVESEELDNEEGIEIEKGGAGSGRKKVKFEDMPSHLQGKFKKVSGRISSIEHDESKNQYHIHGADDEGAKTIASHANAHLDNDDLSYHDSIERKTVVNANIKKAMSAEGASEAGLLPESVEGFKNPNKVPLDEDKKHTVGSLLKKSEVYNLIAEKYTTDLVKAKQIFNLIKSVNTNIMKSNNSDKISQEAIDKAFDFLRKAEEGDITDKEGVVIEDKDGDAGEKNKDLEKAKEMCKSLIEKGTPSDELENEVVKGGFSIETAQSAVSTVVAEMSNLKENGGAVTAASAGEGNTGKDQTLSKAEGTELGKTNDNSDTLTKSEAEELFNTAFTTNVDTIVKSINGHLDNKMSAVGKLLKASFDNNELLKSQIEELASSNEELLGRIAGVEGTAQPLKSIRNVQAVERFAKSEGLDTSGLPIGTQVYNIDDQADRELLADNVQAIVEKSRGLGQKPSEMLERVVADIEIAKTVVPEAISHLRAQNIAIMKNGKIIR